MPDSSTHPVHCEPNWNLWAAFLFLGILLVRLVCLMAFPCDLFGDEAYYWDWGRHLSWGYFSKPPLIAWVMALGSWTGGDTAVGLRLWAILENMGALAFIFLLGRKIYSARVGFWAVAMMAAMPGMVAANVLLTVDPGLLLFWCAALYFLYSFVSPRTLRGRWAFGAGLFIALGLGYLAKQIMWPFMAFAFIWAILGADWKKIPWVGLVCVGALSFLWLLPMVAWNADNNWITFVHTEHHFQGDGWLSFPKNLASFVGGQLGMISPVLAVLVWALGVAGLFFWRKWGSSERFLWVFSALPLAGVVALTLRQSINPNWTAAFYPAGILLVAGWALGGTGASGWKWLSSWRSWFKPALWTAVVMSVLVCAFPIVIHVGGLEGARIDLLARLRGWKDYAAKVQTYRQRDGLSSLPILVVGHRYYVSELAFYLPDHPQVYHWVKPGEIESQYEIWGGLDKLIGQRVLIVSTLEDDHFPDQMGLTDIAKVGPVDVEIGHGRGLRVQLLTGRFEGVLPESK